MCPAAVQRAWWNWNWITKLTKYLEGPQRGEGTGTDPASGCAGEGCAPPYPQVQNPSLEEYHWLWSSTCMNLVQYADVIFSF